MFKITYDEVFMSSTKAFDCFGRFENVRNRFKMMTDQQDH